MAIPLDAFSPGQINDYQNFVDTGVLPAGFDGAGGLLFHSGQRAHGTGTRRVNNPDGSYSFVPDPGQISYIPEAYGYAPEIYSQAGFAPAAPGFKTSPSPSTMMPAQPSAPAPVYYPNWSPPTPEYLTAPGFANYAPTRSYNYTPTGGDWSGEFGSGGGGGGGLTSGDFGGGGDNDVLGGLMSGASLLGGANDLSSFLTGKSLLEHAGIPNPFSNFLGGGEGLSFTDYLPSGIKDALNIYPSQSGLMTPGGGTSLLTDAQGGAMADALGGTEGYFSNPNPYPSTHIPGPESFWGESGAAFRNANNIYPSFNASTQYGTAALTDAQGAAMAEALGGAGNAAPLTNITSAPLGPPSLTPPAPLNLNVPDVFNPATGEWSSNVNLSSAFDGVGMSPAELNMMVPGFDTTLGAASIAADMSPALTNAYMTQAIPEFAGATMPSSLMTGVGGLGATSLAAAAPAMVAGVPGMAAGGFGAGALGGAGMGAGLLGPAAFLGIAAMMLAGREKDPTANTKAAERLSRNIQGILDAETPEDKAELQRQMYEGAFANDGGAVEYLVGRGANDPDLPYGTPRTDRMTEIVGFSPEQTAYAQSILPKLGEIGVQRGNLYKNVGGDMGAVAPINPYSDLDAAYQNQLNALRVGDPDPGPYIVDDVTGRVTRANYAPEGFTGI